jgi:hypothetical protein
MAPANKKQPLKRRKQLFITDPEVVRLIEEEAARTNDTSLARTAGRVIERYFAMRSGQAMGSASQAVAATS